MLNIEKNFVHICNLTTTKTLPNLLKLKKALFFITAFTALSFAPLVNYAQAPFLGTAENFVLFTTVGDVTNSDMSFITGNVGTGSGNISGFTVVNGSLYTADAVTTQASTDLLNAYNQLNSVIPTAYPGAVLGNGQILGAGIYAIAAAASLNLTLTLDGQGNPDAVFIITTGGALTTAASSQVVLINGAKACNVFWKIEGAASFAANTSFKGTIIANNGAISMGAGVQLEGRALSTAGAVSSYSTTAYFNNNCNAIAANWGGAINSDWNLPGNWSNGVVPNGTTNITISAGTPNMNVDYTQFAGRTLTIGGSGALIIAAGKTLTIKGTVDFAGKPVTIKSDSTGTGAIGKVTGTLSGATHVTVERYISRNATRAWRLLSAPASGQTINAAWQEGQPAGGNNMPGFGSLITSPQANAISLGFDAVTSGASMYRYDSAANILKPITNTNVGLIADYPGYFLYIRGDRSQGISSSTTVLSATTLRTAGSLFTGTKTTPIVANKSALVANPFASAIDIRLISFTGTAGATTFNVWDARLNTLGGYQVLTKIGDDYIITPGGGSYNSSVENTIESGQAFFVRGGSNGGTISIGESSKTAGNNQSFKPAGNTSVYPALFTTLNVVKNTVSKIIDGTLIALDNSYDNAIDDFDGLKKNNFTENISMVRNGVKLSVEKRTSLAANDTVFYNISSLLKLPYQLNFRTQNMDAGLTSILEDNYLRISTPVNIDGNTSYNFTVGADPGSFAADRFMLVFKKITVLPDSILSISANRSAAGVQVNWKVAAEQPIRIYEVQRSVDGRTFITAGIKAAVGNRAFNYNLLDSAAPLTSLFYRVKSIGITGELNYSSMVAVGKGKQPPAFTALYNPGENDIINFKLTNQPKGRYGLRLVGITGQQLYKKMITHPGGNSSQLLHLPAPVANGIYLIQVTLPDNSQQVQTLLINSDK